MSTREFRSLLRSIPEESFAGNTCHSLTTVTGGKRARPVGGSPNIPGIEGIDTRALTRRVREHGTLLCVFGPAERIEEMEVILDELTPPDADDLVAQVTCKAPTLLNPGSPDEEGNALPRLAALDCGVKHNILRELCTRFEVVWCPADMPLEEISRDWSPDALFASNGPGDPAHPGAATDARRTLAAAVRQGMPVMGICLGHR